MVGAESRAGSAPGLTPRGAIRRSACRQVESAACSDTRASALMRPNVAEPNTAVRVAVVDVVEDVEDLGADLQPRLAAERDVLHQRQVG